MGLGQGPQVLQQQPCNAFGPKGLEKEGVLLTVVRNLLLALLPMAGCLFPVDQPLRSAKRRNSKERDVVSCLYDFDFLQRNLDNTTISPFIMVFPSNGELSFPWNLLLCGLAVLLASGPQTTG